MTIGELAKMAQVNVETIRYYQRQKLIRTPEKIAGSIRQYHRQDLRCLRFIRRAKQLGFSLKEIEQLLSLDESNCHEVKSIATQKLASIHAKINDLQSFSDALNDLIEQCETDNGANCPIIESLQPKT